MLLDRGLRRSKSILPIFSPDASSAIVGADQRSRPYDMLRTQVLQSMDLNGWKIVGVTSPTPGCGKTLTAINLAFSIARQPDHAIALVDMDLRKPQIAKNLGLYPAGGGVLDLLKERNTLQNVAMPIRVENQRIVVVPTTSTKESSELMNSRAMANLLQNLRRDYQTIVVDLPPILSSDDVIRLLPQIDCVILVAAVGHFKTLRSRGVHETFAVKPTRSGCTKQSHG